jgi:hypothetical protein
LGFKVFNNARTKKSVIVLIVFSLSIKVNMPHFSNESCVVVSSGDPCLKGERGHKGHNGRNGKPGQPETTVTFGAPRLMNLGAEIVSPIDPIYLLFDGNALEGPGLDVNDTSASKVPYTYVAQNRSSFLDVTASITGTYTGAPVNLTVTVLSPSEEVLQQVANQIVMFEPFSSFRDVPLKVKPGNLIRVTAAQGMTLSQQEYSGITVWTRFFSK